MSLNESLDRALDALVPKLDKVLKKFVFRVISVSCGLVSTKSTSLENESVHHEDINFRFWGSTDHRDSVRLFNVYLHY